DLIQAQHRLSQPCRQVGVFVNKTVDRRNVGDGLRILVNAQYIVFNTIGTGKPLKKNQLLRCSLPQAYWLYSFVFSPIPS
ncbi:hypothetical protein, partial [Dickeya dianthicola]|uniref:hypothetical protein n=1 Tax=Dickeya dianthicola TaxID=204039 RepID=UPI0005596F1B